MKVPGLRYDAVTRIARLEIIYPGCSGRKRVRQTLHGVSREQALASWSSLKEAVSNPPPAENPHLPAALRSPLTLSGFIEKFGLPGDLSAGTRLREESKLRSRILPALGSLPVDQITFEVLADVRQKWKTASPASTNGYIRIVRKVLRAAVRRNLLTRLPEFPRPLREPMLRREFSDAQRLDFLNTFDQDAVIAHAKGFFVVAFETGLSRSDLTGLRWDEVHLAEKLILKPRSKTGVVSRVPISLLCHAALSRATSERGIGNPLVFVSKRGRRFNEIVLFRYFHRACNLAGIEGKRLHDIRHSYGSRLASRGVPLLLIRDAMGHSSFSTTLRYARVDESARAVILKAMDE